MPRGTPRSAIFERERHDSPLVLGGQELDVHIDDLVHLGTGVVPPTVGQRGARTPARGLLVLPVGEKAAVDAHRRKIGTKAARLESGSLGFPLETSLDEPAGTARERRAAVAAPADSPGLAVRFNREGCESCGPCR